MLQDVVAINTDALNKNDDFTHSLKKNILPERMDGSSWSFKRSSTFERMNDRPQSLSSNKMARYFKKWTNLSLQMLFEKNILPLKDSASNRFPK